MFVLLLHNKWNPRYLNQELPIPSLWTVNFTQLLIVGYLGEVIDSRFYWNQLQKCCWQNIVITFVSTQWKPWASQWHRILFHTETDGGDWMLMQRGHKCRALTPPLTDTWSFGYCNHLSTTHHLPELVQKWVPHCSKRNGNLLIHLCPFTDLVPSAASWASQVF